MKRSLVPNGHAQQHDGGAKVAVERLRGNEDIPRASALYRQQILDLGLQVHPIH